MAVKSTYATPWDTISQAINGWVRASEEEMYSVDVAACNRGKEMNRALDRLPQKHGLTFGPENISVWGRGHRWTTSTPLIIPCVN